MDQEPTPRELLNTGNDLGLKQESLADQAVDLLYHRLIFKESLNASCSLLQDQVLQLIVDRSVCKVESKITRQLLDDSMQTLSTAQVDSHIDQLAERAMSKIIGRILFEMECLYHVDTIFRTAENAIGNHLMRRLTDEIMEDAINTAARNTHPP